MPIDWAISYSTRISLCAIAMSSNTDGFGDLVTLLTAKLLRLSPAWAGRQPRRRDIGVSGLAEQARRHGDDTSMTRGSSALPDSCCSSEIAASALIALW